MLFRSKKATGKINEAHIDSNGFFTYYDPKLMLNEKGKYVRKPSTKISKKTGKPILGETIPTNKEVRIQRQNFEPQGEE